MGRLTALLCSANEHKLAEMCAALPELELELLAVDYPPEDGETYVDNARIKARHGRAVGPAGAWMLADDSGIEVAALDGAPGVLTARWAQGRHVERLLAALDGAADRRARYVCELVCLAPDGGELRGTGLLDGTIAEAPAGAEGFGFDPVFVPKGERVTVATLGDEWKAQHSHRALAARALRSALAARASDFATS
ncbi:MAG TPA: non-canonical purine NTP pyrophosphatase [Gaiellaceae bacterium]